MTDWGASGRVDDYRFELADPFTLEGRGEYLDAEYGASTVSYGYYTDNYRSAQLSLLDEPPLTSLIRVHHTVTLPDGESASEVLGTFFVDSVSLSASKGATVYSASCYGTLLRYTADRITSGRSLEGGDYWKAYDILTALVTEHGGKYRVTSTATEDRSPQAVSWDEGDAVSSAMRSLAEALGYRLGDDDDGYVTFNAIPDLTSDAAPTYSFEEGAACTFTRGYQLSDTNLDKINCAHASASWEDGHAAVLVRLPSTDPFSYQRIGRDVTACEEYGEEMTVAELREKAQRKLDENSGSNWYYEFEHVGIPGLRHGHVVDYSNRSDGAGAVYAKGFMANMELTLGAGMPTKSKMKVSR